MNPRCCKIIMILLSFIIPNLLLGLIDLEAHSQNFVLGTVRIQIPGHPYAFNPSIIRWRSSLLLSFREIQNPHIASENTVNSSCESNIGLVWLNNDFQPDGPVELLDLNFFSEANLAISRSEDARLISIDAHLYVVYSDNTSEKLTEGGFRTYIAEVDYDGINFKVINIECLIHFEGESNNRREKNWVPFNYQGSLLLAYSLNPHRIFYPFLGTGECVTVASTTCNLNWKWGELRGGTPAILIDADRYLAIFHSSREIPTVHSEGENILHYFMGAYTFKAKPPFEITHISPQPIVAKGFYQGTIYDPYWKPVRVVFPCGILDEGGYLWVTYGRQDHEIWIMKLDKPGLLNSLRTCKSCNP